MTEIFLSYSRKDKAFALKLNEALSKENLDAWVDWEGIPPTADWLAEIYAGIEEADTFVFVISPDSLSSEVCGWELQHAVKHHKRLIPIVYREPGQTEIVQILASHQWISMREENDFEQGVKTVLEAITLDLDWVKGHTRTLTRALEWGKFDRNPSYLLRGADLSTAEDWIGQAKEDASPQPTNLQAEYIIASRKQAAKQQRQLLIGVGVALVLSIGLGVVAFFQWQSAGAERDNAVSEFNRASTQEALAFDAQGVAEEQQLIAEEALAVQIEQAKTIEAQARLSQAQALGATSLNTVETDPQLALLLALYGAQATLEDGVLVPDVRQGLFAGIDSPLLKSFSGFHGGGIVGVGLDETENILVTAGREGYLVYWDMETGEVLSSSRDTGYQSMVINPVDVNIALLASDPAVAGIWAVDEHGEKVYFAKIASSWNQAFSVSYHPDGNSFAAGFKNSDIMIFNGSGAFLRSMAGWEAVNQVKYSADGSLLVAAYADGSAAVWNPDTGELVNRFSGHAASKIQAGARDTGTYDIGGTETAAIDPNNRLLVTGGTDGLVILWSIETGAILKSFRPNEEINDVLFSPDGALLAAAGEDGTIYVWDVTTRSIIREFEGHNTSVEKLVFFADGSKLISGGSDGTAKVWQLVSQNAKFIFNADTENRYGDADLSFVGTEGGIVDVQQLAFSFDDATLLGSSVVADAQDIYAYDVVGGDIDHLAGAIDHFAPYQDGLIYKTSDAKIVYYNLLAQEKETLLNNQNPFATVNASGSQMLFAGTWNLYVQEIETEDILFEVSSGSGTIEDDIVNVGSAVFSPDGDYVAYGSVFRLRIVHVPDGERVAELIGHTGDVLKIAFSADGTLMASASRDGSVKVWDFETYELLYTFSEHQGAVNDLAFSANGDFLVSVGEDATAIFWDLALGVSFRSISDHVGGISAVAMSADGRLLATGGQDFNIYVYALEMDTVIEQALSRLSRGDLTEAECMRYLQRTDCVLNLSEAVGGGGGN